MLFIALFVVLSGHETFSSKKSLVGGGGAIVESVMGGPLPQCVCLCVKGPSDHVEIMNVA